MSAVPVYFYLPCGEPEFNRMPTRLSEYEVWQYSETGLTPFKGIFHWVLQTYLQLREARANVELVRELPPEGIIVSHIECLQYGARPSAKTMLVPMLVDKNIPLPHASIHITHNPVQRLPLRLMQHYIPPWPQIGLVPRAAERGECFENVAFVGYPENLHPALSDSEFIAQLGSLGLKLVIPPPSKWHDFSQIDCVLAVRNFGRSESHLNKPALKLYNAWLAGVPAVLGFESAYRAEGRSGYDYLEATDRNEVLVSLEQLASNLPFRAGVVSAGKAKMQERTELHLRAQWMTLIEQTLVPRYARWRNERLFRMGCQMGGAIRERLLWRNPGWFEEARNP